MIHRRFIDLKSKLTETGGSAPLGKEPHDEFGQNDFRSTDGFHSFRIPISSGRRTLQRSLQGQEFFLLGSVSHLSLCSTYVSRKSQRYRSLPANHTAKALSHGHSQHRLAQHSGQRQPSARLAHLCRLRPNPDPRSSDSLQGRILWPRTRPYGLRPRCHHDRFVSVAVPLGTVPAAASPLSNSTRCSICAAAFPQW